MGFPLKMLVKTVVLVSGEPDEEAENITSELSFDSLY
jgi:hypothetical protein